MARRRAPPPGGYYPWELKAVGIAHARFMEGDAGVFRCPTCDAPTVVTESFVIPDDPEVHEKPAIIVNERQCWNRHDSTWQRDRGSHVWAVAP